MSDLTKEFPSVANFKLTSPFPVELGVVLGQVDA